YGQIERATFAPSIRACIARVLLDIDSSPVPSLRSRICRSNGHLDNNSSIRVISTDFAWADNSSFKNFIPHSIQGLEPDGAEFLLVFDDGHFSEHETVLLSDIAAHIPREIMARNFGVEPKALEGIFNKELLFSMRQFLDRLLKTKKRQPELSAVLHVNFLSDPANKVSPRKRKVAKPASSIQRPSKSPRPWPPRLLLCIPADCVRFTGTRTRTNGNTT